MNWSKMSKIYDVEDFVDRFLLLVKYNFDTYKRLYPGYFGKMEKFENFVEINFLMGSYVDENYDVNEYSDIVSEKTSNTVWEYIKNRAEVISKSEKYWEKLWEFFSKWGLVE